MAADDPKCPPQCFHDLGKQGEGAKTLIGGHFGSSGGHFGAADQLFGGSKMATGRKNIAGGVSFGIYWNALN